MKIKVFVIIFFFSFIAFSQNNIKGIVLSYENIALEGASVYLNNTMVGGVTNKKGEFTLKTKNGKYEIIISYLGFKKIIQPLNTSTYNKPLVFKLIEEENILNEVVLRKTKYDADWKYNLSRFKKEFIGTTEFSKNCTIQNPKALHFDFDPKKNILSAFAKEPLLIRNKDLGYTISYELVSFIIKKNYVSYLGYSQYKSLKGGKRKQKRWNRNRKLAYKGSPIHFFKSIINNTFTKEGYIVNQFKRVKNPESPSEKEIKLARELIRSSRSSIVFGKDYTKPKNAMDSARLVLSKARLPKFRDYLYKSKLTKNDVISLKDSLFHLSFKDNLSIVYNKEKEESGYLLRLPFNKRKKGLPQTSSIIPLKKNSSVDKNGLLFNPLDVYYEGYWSYEKFANSLPLDYQPGD